MTVMTVLTVMTIMTVMTVIIVITRITVIMKKPGITGIIIIITMLYSPFSRGNVQFMTNKNVFWCLRHVVLVYNNMRYNK